MACKTHSRKRFARAQHKVQQQAGNVEDDDERDRDHLHHQIARARANIAECPDDQTEPDRDQIHAEERGDELQERSERTQIERQ